ncbi:hypothetical protein EYZ11_000160 [Aspergillus tanneri]|uniref:Transaldolase n=1 Tax=Aspergillus tanneri TaxID=1220188 RepID=A0A4S3JY14_9EURO|nr:hypothetical protein EYZ11_000160 [Aspergillus tanneri]
MAVQTGLDVLRTRTIVDCDTLDEQVAKKLGPFQDCTSNQAIAYSELCKPEHAELIVASVADARSLLSRFPNISVEELAVEVAMVRLALKIAPHIRGNVHVQTNPYYSYSTEKTIENALSTWEGMMACRTLEQAGVRTLATTLFTMTQAVLAAEVGCTYVAPYVNQLRVHFEPGFTDPNKLLPLCVLIQKYYESIEAKTQVIVASLASVYEIFALAGERHITVPPGLLEELSRSATAPGMQSLFDANVPVVVPPSNLSYVNDEPAYRIAFTRDLHGASEEKLIQV